MDLDTYVAAHDPEWRRLDELVRRRRRSGPEADELVTLYRRAATQLSYAQSHLPDERLLARLSNSIHQARLAIQGVPRTSFAGVGDFFVYQFPAAVYRRWHYHVIAAALTIGIAAGFAWYFMADPSRLGSFLSEPEAQQIAQQGFVQYYFETDNATFFSRVWVNNSGVSALAIAGGVTGVLVVVILWSNAVNLGLMAAVMHIYGQQADFWVYLLPHGMIELTCVFVALGGGFSLFMSWVRPGANTRTGALAREGRVALSLSIGLAIVLLMAGLLEGFVTPSAFPPAVRLSLGALVWAAFIAYVWVLGRRAVALGVDGDLARSEAGYEAVMAD
ncbi:stage II sporulation protein M [Micrococcales bacterium 31B]|nr:stage II sporulation protein M [Micrococcales bacterium 31B]